MLGRVTMLIGKAGGDIGAVDLVEMTRDRVFRDITIKARDSEHAQRIIDRLRTLAGVKIANISDRTFLMHLGGKIEVRSKVPIRTRDDLSMAYTPGVARVCQAIKEDPQRAFSLTIKQNTVAVVTDGTAVLGLGDIGPEAAMPVMEGKAMLFKELAAWMPSDLPRHQGPRPNRRDGQVDRPRLRRHQPRGHFSSALLRHRGAAAQGARHPGFS
jgi:malate dehydrogenase (oxaloacetate-decarboxylating)